MTRLVGRRLAAASDPATREWWERYLKGALPFRGTKMADIRSVVHGVWDEKRLGEIDADTQIDLALSFLAKRYSEDKIAGVLVLAERLIDDLRTSDAPRLARSFELGHIQDWSTCDWYCVKVLGRFIERQDIRARARAIAAWRDADGLWQRRAAAVAFVYLARQGDSFFSGFTSLLLKVCATNVKSPERFSQTSVGWLLRELSHAEPERVAAFVEKHRGSMSREAEKAAMAKLGSLKR